ncbi:AAA domain-containing protein [Sporocytophaga myxococcoides]|uniref:AAA domain-containing protein n=1 Tax=Sporocytophaga myxococcoides TaxID=153721 RepID=UPI00040EFAEF|nr:AAA domain-containing protein [Sporocytophaga myxococcoides]
MQQVLKSYLKKLTNLTGQNKSLLMLRLTASDLDLHDLDFVNQKPSFDILSQLIAGKTEINLCEIADSRNEKINEASSRLKKIQRQDALVFEERGAKDLYIGYPFVKGKLQDGTLVRCPLLFFPVNIFHNGFTWKLEFRKDLNISFNKSLLLAYIHFNKIALSDELIEEDFDDFSKDPLAFRTALYELIKDSPISLNFNQDLMADKLSAFKEYTREDFEENHFNGELKLYPEAVLGMFPQAGSYLVPDYECIIERDEFKDVSTFFDTRSNASDETLISTSTKIKEEQTFTPFSLDGSQENAIKAVKSGKSVVVQGPPGTGKSQFICNLICDFVARRKRVLLVSQKRAALDVVYERIRQTGADAFLCLVQDFKNDRKEIYSKIESQIDRLDEYKTENSSLDAMSLERSFLQISRRIDQLTEELENYKQGLFDEKEFGISAKQLYLTSNPEKEIIDLKDEYKYFSQQSLAPFATTLKFYYQYNPFRQNDYVWKDRISFANLTNADQREIKKLTDTIPVYVTDLLKETLTLTGQSLTLSDVDAVSDKQKDIAKLLELLEDDDIFDSFIFLQNKKTDKNWLRQKEQEIENCLSQAEIETSISDQRLHAILPIIDKAIKAQQNIFTKIIWSVFSKDKTEVVKILTSNRLKLDSIGLEELSKRIHNRILYNNITSELKECPWIANVPESINITSFRNWFSNHHQAIEAKDIFNKSGLKKYISVNSSHGDFINKWEKLIALANAYQKERKLWLNYLTLSQTEKIIQDKNFAEALQSGLKKDFDFLKEMDELENTLASYERSTLQKLLLQEPENADKALELCKNSLYLQWIDHIENKYPVLKTAGTFKLEQLEEELISSIEAKLKISKDILLLRAKERTYNAVQYNRLSNRITYRELKHQVSKKKKIWPLRKLIQEFHEELFELIPCWMASPESVSSIFPLDPLFDVVIFDEASQCFAERGIPAMYRGKQIVIAGDEKQLKPADLYQIRFDDDTEDHPDIEAESLLHLGQNYLMQVYLQGHYRSKTNALIEFSNNHFYKGRLKMIPDKNDLNNNDTAIKFIKIDGMWEKRANHEEASYIVMLVQKLLKENKSIGVVTFNYTQASLIQDLFDEQTASGAITLPDDFFVKNIENVQGDERDIIIFSIGYAKDLKGRLAMQFGALNMDGGANRLNVAITRAKEKIYIISSILPSEMDVTSAKHEGPKLLKAYLQYAYAISEGKAKQDITQVGKNSEAHLSTIVKNLAEEDLKGKTMTNEFTFSDLSIAENNQYHSLVLTDDNLYFQSVSIKDFHAYLPMTLKKKNWNYLKLNSRQYWSDRNQFKDKIVTYIKHA